MEPRQPTADERADALKAAGWRSGGTWTPSAAAAWTLHKKRLGLGIAQ